MAAVLSRRDFERYTPPSRAEEEPPPVYLIAPLTWREKANWQSDLVRVGAVWVPDEDLIAAVEAAIVEVAPDNLDELLEVFERVRSQRADPLDVAPPRPAAVEGIADEDLPGWPEYAAAEAALEERMTTARQYGDIERSVRAHYRVAGLLADRRKFNAMAGPLAAAYALRGWENIDVAFVRRGGVVPDEVLEQIPPNDLQLIGARAITMNVPTEADRKN